MTVILDLAPETEKRLKTEAIRRGVSPNQFVQSMLEENLRNGKNKNRAMAGILNEMLAEGMISHIPIGVTDEEDDFEPIKVTGKPFSETILEHRN